MYRPEFGTKGQIQFETPEDYYEFLGFLSKDDGSTRLVWEPNDEAGAWGQEGRIQFYVDHPDDLQATLLHTAGNGSIISRVNCNDFVEHINIHHGFVNDADQDEAQIRGTIPRANLQDFDRGQRI